MAKLAIDATQHQHALWRPIAGLEARKGGARGREKFEKLAPDMDNGRATAERPLAACRARQTTANAPPAGREAGRWNLLLLGRRLCGSFCSGIGRHIVTLCVVTFGRILARLRIVLRFQLALGLFLCLLFLF